MRDACRSPRARRPTSGEAFRSDQLATVIGLLVVAIAIVAAAAISLGSAGYIGVFLALPEPVLVTGVVVAMAAIAAWGINESVSFAGVMTVIEIGGLVMLILAGMAMEPDLVRRLPEALPPLTDGRALAGIVGTTLLAVFAFIGFEGLANVAEEVRDPQRTLPRAIFLTLTISTMLYVLVVWVALVAVPQEELAQSKAPLALVFERLTGASPRAMSADRHRRDAQRHHRADHHVVARALRPRAAGQSAGRLWHGA